MSKSIVTKDVIVITRIGNILEKVGFNELQSTVLGILINNSIYLDLDYLEKIIDEKLGGENENNKNRRKEL